MDQPSGTGAATELTEPPRPPLTDVFPSPLPTPNEAASTRTALASAVAPVRVPAGHDSPQPRQTEKAPAGFWWSHADQFMLAFLSAIVLILLAAYWVRASKWNTAPIEIEHLDHHTIEFKIDINSATWVEWNQLDGIGDSLARRIVDDREQNGPFQSVDDLRRVKGIGPKTLERLRPWLTIDQTPEKQAP